MPTNEMTAIEAARMLNVGLDYLYGLLWTGKLEGRKVNSRWMIPTRAVERRLQAVNEKADRSGYHTSTSSGLAINRREVRQLAVTRIGRKVLVQRRSLEKLSSQGGQVALKGNSPQ